MPRRSRVRGGLTEWMSQAELPLFVVDSRRVVLYFNSGCEQLTGWTAADVIGKHCELRSDGDPAQLTSLLAAMIPPAEVDATSRRVYLLCRDGKSLERIAHFFPLTLDADVDTETPVRWLGMIGTAESIHQISSVPADSERHAELTALKSDLRRTYSFSQVIARDSTMKRVLARLQLAIPSNTTIALSGLSGTGKEHLARSVHYAGENRVQAFVPVDCRQSTGPLDVLLRRLIHPERDELPIPVLRVGAVLLQHVEELPRDWQRKLTDEVDLATSPAAVRWMLASERSFDVLIEEEKLIPEFLDRFGVLEVRLPPLRQRLDDLPLLALHALEEYNTGSAKQIFGFSPEVLKAFHAYNWPGQLDELFAVVREARDAAAGPLVSVADLPFRFRTGQDAQTVSPPVHREPILLEELLMRVEKDHLMLALTQSGGSKQQAAEFLGIPRAKLYRRLEAHGLWKPGEVHEDRE